jgi:hypothetical protein
MLTPRNHLPRAVALAGLCALLAWLGGPQAGLAQVAATVTDQGTEPAESAAYRAAIDSAVRSFAAGRWTEARSAFEQAHALAPSARTFRGLGLAAFYLHDYVAARVGFEQALHDDRKPLTAEQRAELTRLLGVTQRETGRFELHLQPSAARIVVDGTPISERVLVLERGIHVLALDADGCEPLRLQLSVSGEEDRKLEFSLLARGMDTPTLAPHSRAPTPQPHEPELAVIPAAAQGRERDAPEHRHPRRWTWVALAAVPVFAGTAAALWLTGQAKHDRVASACMQGCSSAEAERRLQQAGVQSYATWTSVSLMAAGAAAVAAGVLFFVEPGSDRSRPVTLALGLGSGTLSAEF